MFVSSRALPILSLAATADASPLALTALTPPPIPSRALRPQHAECVAAAAMRCDVHALTWSPTNGALACGGSDGRAHLLKPTGELLGRIPGDADAEAEYPDASGPPAIRALAFSKGSRYLATGGASDEIALWDLKRKSKLKSLAGRAGDARAVAYSPGDQHVASAGSAGVVVLHSPVSGLVVGEMAPPTSFDGVRGGAENAAPPGVTSLHYSPHRRQSLATSCEDGCVRLWDAGVRRLAGTIDACAKTNVPCAFARFSPADADVLAAASSRGVCFLDAAVSRASFASFDVGAPATSLAWRSDGGALAVGAADGRVIWLDPRMLGGRSSGDKAHPSVLYTTAARVGGGGGVDAVRWQTAPEGALVAESRAAAAAEAVTPTPMRLNRGGGDRASSFEDGGFARTPGSDDAVDLGTNAAAASPRLFPSPAAAAAANPSSFGASFDASARAADAPPTPTMGKTPTNAGASASVGRARSLSPTEEETRRRVERLMSARGAGGTPEALAAATRPTRGDPRGDPDSGPADADALAGMIAEAVREAVRESLEASVRAEVRNVHLEVIRQFHDAREEQTRMFEELRAAQAALARDVAALRRSQREFVRR